MWGQVIVAFIGLVGVLAPAYWNSRADVRERAALKDYVEILSSLPEGVRRQDLTTYIERKFWVLQLESNPRRVALTKLQTRMRRTRWGAYGLVIFIGYLMVVQIFSNGEFLPTWALVALMLGLALAYGLTLNLFAQRKRYRTAQAIQWAQSLDADGQAAKADRAASKGEDEDGVPGEGIAIPGGPVPASK